MKFENLMLHSLFAACFLVCVLTLGAMVSTSAPQVSAVASASHTTATNPAG